MPLGAMECCVQQPGVGLRHLLHHGKHKAALPPCPQLSVHAKLQACKDAALGMGTEQFAVAWCGWPPAQPRCVEFSGRGGCEVLALTAPQHRGGANQKQSQPLFPLSTHGPSSSGMWAPAQIPSGRASPADWELRSLTREMAFIGCLWGFCKMKRHGPACPGIWIKPHISPLAV